MKKLLNIVFIFLLINIFQINLYATIVDDAVTESGEDACSSVDFKNLKCDIKIGISSSQSCKNSNIIPEKVYNLGNARGVCYYDSSKKAYFYGVYARSKSGSPYGANCNLAYEAYVPVSDNYRDGMKKNTSANWNGLDIWLSDSKVTAQTGCAPYMVYSKDDGRVLFSSNLNFTLDDVIVATSPITDNDINNFNKCVYDKVVYNCNENTLDTDNIKRTIDGCVTEIGISSSSKEESDNLKDSAKTYIAARATDTKLYCDLKKECKVNAFSSEILFQAKFPDWAKLSNREDENIINQYFPTSDILPNQPKCIIDYFNVDDATKKQREEENKKLEESIDSAIDSSVDDAIDKVDDYQNDATIPANPDLDIDGNVGTCSEILGDNLTKLVKAAVRIVQIVGVIIVIVNAMISLIPAIIAKDQEGLKKAVRKCIYMAIVLILLLLLGTIIKLIGMIFGFDTSCFV